MAAATPPFWISTCEYNLLTTYDQDYAYSTGLSVVFDQGLHKSFSGVEFVIVTKTPDDVGSGCVDTLSEEPDDTGMCTDTESENSYDAELYHSRRAPNPTEEELPLLTLLLCLERKPKDLECETGPTPFEPGEWFLSSVSAAEYSSIPSADILFEESYPFQSCDDVTIFAEIDSTVPLQFGECGPYSLGCPNILQFRILPEPPFSPEGLIPTTPSPSQRSPVNGLPTEILLTIARYTIHQARRYRRGTVNKSLLGLALVQKSWKPILAVLYSSIGRKNRITHPHLVANGLQRQPELRHYLKHFILAGQDDPVMKRSHPTWRFRWELMTNPRTKDNIAYSRILELSAKSITTIDMEYSLLYPLGHLLPQLPEVKKCVLEQNRTYWKFGIDRDALSHIYPALSQWNRLKYLRIAMGPVACKRLVTHSQIPRTPPPFALSHLFLESSPFNGPQLRWILLASASTLKTLHLTGIDGLNEVDIHEIVIATHLTLINLFIDTCRIIPSPIVKVDADPQKPLDILIPRMTKLKQLRVPPILVTPAVIANQPPLARTRVPHCVLEVFPYQSDPGSAWAAENLLSALPDTGWAMIWLNFAYESEIEERAKWIAREQGCHLRISRGNWLRGVMEDLMPNFNTVAQ